MSDVRKILFLDIDGVLNSVQFAHYCNILDKQNPDEDREWRPYKDFDPMCLTNLHDIVSSTGCEIVWSTTWRLGTPVEELNATVEKGFKRWGIDFKIPAISKTPVLRRTDDGSSMERGLEIQRWLDDNVDEKWGDKVRFAILDDDCDMAHLVGHFVNTDSYVGLTWRDAQKVKTMLGEIKPWRNSWEENGWFVKTQDEPNLQYNKMNISRLGTNVLAGAFDSKEDGIRWAHERGLKTFKVSHFHTYPDVVYEDGQIKK